MRPDPEALRAAREVLAAFDAPVCGCPLGVEVDDFGGVHCPLCRCVYGWMRDPCPECGWLGDFYCDKPVGHDGNHGAGFGDVDPEHLRAALAEVDHLANVLLVERGEGVPPSPEWRWEAQTGRWIRYHGDDLVAIVSRWACVWGVDARRGNAQVLDGRPTAFEAMEAANAALGVG